MANNGRFQFLDTKGEDEVRGEDEIGKVDLTELGPVGQELTRQLQMMYSREKEVYKQVVGIADRLAFLLYTFGIREDIRLPMDYVAQFNKENEKQKIWPFELVKINMQEGKVVSAYVVNEPNTPYHDVVWRFDQDIKDGLIQKWVDFVKARIDKDNQMVPDFTEVTKQITFIKMPPSYKHEAKV
jgi:hypothetical protein